MTLDVKWKPFRNGIMQAKTPAGLAIDQLFVSGQRQPIARYPNYDANVRPYGGYATDAFSKERATRWADPTGGYIHAMHRAHWGGYHYRITGKDAKGEVTFEGGWQNNRQMGMHPQHRYVENIFEELDVPGEWFHNRRIRIAGCDIHDTGASAVAFVGDPNAVREPLFEYNQRLRYTAIDKTPGPKTDNYPADCVVEDCIIRHVGVVEKQATGVQITMAQDITIRHCSIYDASRAGINIGDDCWGGHVIEFCDVFDTVKETGDHGSFNSWGRGATANSLPTAAEVGNGLSPAPAARAPLAASARYVRRSRCPCPARHPGPW